MRCVMVISNQMFVTKLALKPSLDPHLPNTSNLSNKIKLQPQICFSFFTHFLSLFLLEISP